MKTNITNAINLLTSALVKIGTDDKGALGDLSSANVYLEKACCALNNKIYPEGTTGHIKLNDLGLPAEEPAKNTSSCPSSANGTTSRQSDEKPSYEPKSAFDREMDFLSSNLPNFTPNDLAEAYSKRGITGAVKYLLDLTGTNVIGDVAIVTTSASKVLNFSVGTGLVSEYKDLVREHIVTLLGFVGYKLVNCDIVTSDDGAKTTFNFSIARKPVEKTDRNCYVVSPFLVFAARMLEIL